MDKAVCARYALCDPESSSQLTAITIRMSTDTGELTVQALGRPAFLGQLYSATIDDTINFGLFPEDVSSGKHVITSPMPHTDVAIKVVKNSRERSHLLDVNAKVSLSILGGMVKLKGMGKYVDSSDKAEETTTISGVVRCRTIHQRLDPGDRGLLHSAVISNERLKTIGATHVITAITYGGTLVASLSETKSQSASNNDIDGNFSLSILKSFGALAGAEGSGALTQTEIEKLKNSSLTPSLVADYVDYDENMPDLIKALERGLPGYTTHLEPGPKKTHGIPVDLVLTPLTYFNQVSNEIIYRELAQTDLEELCTFYDALSSLRQRRNSLKLEIENMQATTPPSNVPAVDSPGSEAIDGNRADHPPVLVPYTELFPSLYKTCTDRSNAVQNFYLTTRTRLGRFLKNYRSQTQASETVGEWLSAGKDQYAMEVKLLDQDTAAWANLLQLARTCVANGFPLTASDNVEDQMTIINKSIVLFLIPENQKVSSLLEEFRDSGGQIRTWRDEQDTAISAEASTEYLSFYADPLLDNKLLGMETMEGSFAYALASARTTSAPACMMYAFREDRNRASWMALNHEHWGSFISVETKSRYIGYVKNGLPHGAGAMTYVNGFSYNGDWSLGKHDGNGIFSRDIGAAPASVSFLGGAVVVTGTVPAHKRCLFEGLWMENQKAQVGRFWLMDPTKEKAEVAYAVPVEVTVYQGNESVATATMCVSNGPGPHTQLEKIAKVLDWDSSQRYRLTPVLQVDGNPDMPGAVIRSEFSIIARGSQIEAGPYPDASTREEWDWPDETVTWNGESRTLFEWSRYLRPFPPVMGPDPDDPAKRVLQSGRTRPIKIQAVLLS